MAILPGPDLFMANRFAEAVPRPFVHGYGAKGKSVLRLWGKVHRLPTLPEAIWGNGDAVPLWASVGGKGNGPVRIQLFLEFLMYWKKEALSSCGASPKWRSRPNTPKGPLAILTAAAHSCFAQADVPWPLFTADTQATSLGLSRYWDDSLALRVHQALAAFGFPAYQHPPPKPHRTPAGECRSLFISGMNGRGENAPASVSGSIIHTANSYALTGLEMEQVREDQGRPVRYDLTHRPLLLSSSMKCQYKYFGGPDVRCQKFMVAGTPNSGPQTCSISYFWRLHYENQHTTHRHTIQDNRRPQEPTDPQRNMPNHQPS